jgi:hypothetical protein
VGGGRRKYSFLITMTNEKYAKQITIDISMKINFRKIKYRSWSWKGSNVCDADTPEYNIWFKTCIKFNYHDMCLLFLSCASTF